MKPNPGPESNPKYQLICDALEREIRSLRHAPGRRFITAAEVQRRFKVSSITATHALNRLRDQGLVVRRRRHGTFVAERPFRMKARPPADDTRIVGVIWEALPATQRGIDLLRTIEATLSEAGHGLMFKASNGQKDPERKCLEWFHAHGIRRVLMTPWGSRADWQMYEEFRQRGMRIVFMDRGVDAPGFPLVEFDDRRVGDLAVCELRQAGYRRIALLTTARRDTSVDARVEGVVQACASQCLELQMFSVSIEEFYRYAREPAAMKGWWRRIRPKVAAPCGWFAVNELLATALLETMLEAGVPVPSEHGVIGVGNGALTPAAALFLSSIELPFAELGRAVARCAVDDQATGMRLAPAGVVRRASTTPGLDIQWEKGLGQQKFQTVAQLTGAAP